MAPWRIPALLVIVLLIQGRPGDASGNERKPWSTYAGGRDQPPRISGLAQRIYQALQHTLATEGAPACQLSQRLSIAAEAHGGQLLKRGVAPGHLASQTVRQEVWRAGGVAPVVVPWAYAFTTPSEPIAEVARFARRVAERPMTHCGIAVMQGPSRRLVVIIGIRRRVQLEAFPTQLARGDQVRLAGSLVGDYRRAAILVSTPLGQIRRRQTGHRRFASSVSFPLPGRYIVEVMAEGPHGPEIVALFPVFVDLPPGSGEAGRRPRAAEVSADGATLVRGLGRLINQTRHEAGRPPLALDRQLAEVARLHCNDMARNHFFGHVNPAGRGLDDRLRRAEVVSHRAAENLVRSANAVQAHRRLMESPAHRSNILDPDLTHLGVAAVPYRGEWLVTQIFVEW